MAGKYKPTRMPLEAYKNFIVRQKKMEEVAKEITGRIVKIPLTEIYRESSRTPIKISDKRIIKIITGRKRRIVRIRRKNKWDQY